MDNSRAELNKSNDVGDDQRVTELGHIQEIDLSCEEEKKQGSSHSLAERGANEGSYQDSYRPPLIGMG